MSMSLHKGKGLRMHPNALAAAASGATRTPTGPRSPGPPRASAAGPSASPGGAAPSGAQRGGRRPGSGRRGTMRPASRPPRASAAGPWPTQKPAGRAGPGLPHPRRRAPTVGSSARLPQRLGHRLPDVAAQQAEQQRRRPAHLLAAGAPAGWASPTPGTERRVRGGRSPRPPPCRRAPRAPGPPPDWPRPRPARRRAPQPPASPSSAHPGGFPEATAPRSRPPFNPFAPRPARGRRPLPGPGCHLAAAAPRGDGGGLGAPRRAPLRSRSDAPGLRAPRAREPLPELGARDLWHQGSPAFPIPCCFAEKYTCLSGLRPSQLVNRGSSAGIGVLGCDLPRFPQCNAILQLCLSPSICAPREGSIPDLKASGNGILSLCKAPQALGACVLTEKHFQAELCLRISRRFWWGGNLH